MTFRTELKKKLNELAYPVEISKWYANGRGIRCAGREIIFKEGIKIIRDRFDEYKPSLHIKKYTEYVRVYTNGFIDDDKMAEIVTDVFNEYVLPYGIVNSTVCVYGENNSSIIDLRKGKNSSYFDLSESDKMKLAMG